MRTSSQLFQGGKRSELERTIAVLVRALEDAHHLQAAVHRDRRVGGLHRAAHQRVEVLHLEEEVVGPRLVEAELLRLLPVERHADEIVALLAVPLGRAELALGQCPLLLREREDVLHHPADLARVGLEGEGAERIVLRSILLAHVHEAGTRHRLAELGRLGEGEPEVQRMRMLAARTAAALPVPEIGVLGSLEPRMRLEDPLPVAAELHVEHEDLADQPGLEDQAHLVRRSGDRMVVAHHRDGARLLGVAVEEPVEVRVPRAAQRLLEQKDLGTLLEHLGRETHAHVRRRTEEDQVVALLGLLTEQEESDGLVPSTVALGIEARPHAVERRLVGVDHVDAPTHATRGLREVVADGAGAVDLDLLHVSFSP